VNSAWARSFAQIARTPDRVHPAGADLNLAGLSYGYLKIPGAKSADINIVGCLLRLPFIVTFPIGPVRWS